MTTDLGVRCRIGLWRQDWVGAPHVGLLVTKVGELVAAGGTSDVYRYGEGAVIKVPRPGVPAHWASVEARFTAAVGALGLPVAKVFGLEAVEDRESIVFEHVVGPSMWDLMVDKPSQISALSRELAQLQASIAAAGIPEDVPGWVDRTSGKLGEVEALPESERGEAITLAVALPRGAALLHGDLHPGNVLMGDSGMAVIDWFDASIGHPAADVIRTTLLIRPSDQAAGPPHLPNAAAELLELHYGTYLEQVAAIMKFDDDVLVAWESVVAAARLSERGLTDHAALRSLWLGRADPSRSPLVQALSGHRDRLDQTKKGGTQ